MEQDQVQVVEPQSAEQCALLRDRLTESRRETAEALTRFATFRQAVRTTILENVESGTICREGANAALESWGEQPLMSRYTVRARIDVTVTLDADDADDARHAVYNRLSVTADELDCSVDDTAITYIRKIDDEPRDWQ